MIKWLKKKKPIVNKLNTFADMPIVEPIEWLSGRHFTVRCPVCDKIETVGLTDFDLESPDKMFFRTCLWSTKGFMVKLK